MAVTEDLERWMHPPRPTRVDPPQKGTLVVTDWEQLLGIADSYEDDLTEVWVRRLNAWRKQATLGRLTLLLEEQGPGGVVDFLDPSRPRADLDAAVAKHLAGQHDQKRHAGGGGLMAPLPRSREQESLYGTAANDLATTLDSYDGETDDLAMRDWRYSFAGCSSIQATAEQMLGLPVHDPTFRERDTRQHGMNALNLTRRLRDSPADQPELYRGVRTSKNPQDLFPEGRTFNQPLASFDTDPGWASSFTVRSDPTEVGDAFQVRFTLAPGARGVTIDGDSEVVSGGQFRVSGPPTSHTFSSGTTAWYVPIVQVGVFDPDATPQARKDRKADDRLIAAMFRGSKQAPSPYATADELAASWVRKHLPGRHPQARHSGKGGGADDPSVEPGTAAIPDAPGTVRLYHYTSEENLDSIAAEGLLQDRSKGGSYGEPSVVWASTQKPNDDVPFVEFHANVTDLDIGSPTGGRRATDEAKISHAEFLTSRHSNVTMLGDVPASSIVHVNRPWHETYRELTGSEDMRARFRNGDYDFLRDDATYGPAWAQASADLVGKHQAGRHDQKRHAGGGGAGPPRAEYDRFHEPSFSQRDIDRQGYVMARHVTTPENAAAIREGGFDLAHAQEGLSEFGAGYGPGVYAWRDSGIGAPEGEFWINEFRTKNETGLLDAETLDLDIAPRHALDFDAGQNENIPAAISSRYPHLSDGFAQARGQYPDGALGDRRALGDAARAAGHDALIFLHWGEGGDEIVAFDPAIVTVAAPRGTNAPDYPYRKGRVTKRLEERDGWWYVIADSGRKMGRYRTREAAQRRLRQIEHFKKARRKNPDDEMADLLMDIQAATQEQVGLGHGRLDLWSRRAAAWAQHHSATQIRGIDDNTRDAIRKVIAAGQRRNGTITEQARDIRDMVGLTESQATAVLNYRATLEGVAAGRIPAASVTQALHDNRPSRLGGFGDRTGPGMSQATIDQAVDRYRERWVNHRARTIARTETMSAANAGLWNDWQAAADAGYIDRDQSRAIWVATPDDRTCDICLTLDEAGRAASSAMGYGTGYAPEGMVAPTVEGRDLDEQFGDALISPLGADPASAGVFDPTQWAAMPMADRRNAWEALSEEQRDLLADPVFSVQDAQDRLLAGVPSWDDGDDLAASIRARVAGTADRLPESDRSAVEKFSTAMYHDLVSAGVEDDLARSITRDATDNVLAQSIESLGRTLGDHGIRHVAQDADYAMKMMREMGAGDPRTMAMARLTAAYHDSGYLTPPSHFFLDEGHPRWSAQFFEAKMRDRAAGAFGDDTADMLTQLIATHDAPEIDWHRAPFSSAFRTADNLALFHAEKLPPFMYHVPSTVDTIVRLGEGRISASDAADEVRALIRASGQPPMIQAQMLRSADEITDYLPKASLGMVGNRLKGFTWDAAARTMAVTLEHRRASEALGNVLDLYQGQFRKLAKTYGLNPDDFLSSGRAEFVGSSGTVDLILEILERATKTVSVPGGVAWHDEPPMMATEALVAKIGRWNGPGPNRAGGAAIAGPSGTVDTSEALGAVPLAGWGGKFRLSDTSKPRLTEHFSADHPPAHPGCRCTMSLLVEGGGWYPEGGAPPSAVLSRGQFTEVGSRLPPVPQPRGSLTIPGTTPSGVPWDQPIDQFDTVAEGQALMAQKWGRGALVDRRDVARMHGFDPPDDDIFDLQVNYAGFDVEYTRRFNRTMDELFREFPDTLDTGDPTTGIGFIGSGGAYNELLQNAVPLPDDMTDDTWRRFSPLHSRAELPELRTYYGVSQQGVMSQFPGYDFGDRWRRPYGGVLAIQARPKDYLDPDAGFAHTLGDVEYYGSMGEYRRRRVTEQSVRSGFHPRGEVELWDAGYDPVAIHEFGHHVGFQYGVGQMWDAGGELAGYATARPWLETGHGPASRIWTRDLSGYSTRNNYESQAEGFVALFAWLHGILQGEGVTPGGAETLVDWVRRAFERLLSTRALRSAGTPLDTFPSNTALLGDLAAYTQNAAQTVRSAP